MRMKKLNNILGFVICLLILTNTGIAQDCKATIEVKTDIAGASVFVDDSLAGTGSMSIELPLGEYTIKVVKEYKVWDTSVLEENVVLTECDETAAYEFTFEEEVYVETEPDDAYVYEADTLIGHTPLFIPLDVSRIELRKPKYENKIIELSNYNAVQPVPLNFTGEKRQERFGESTWFKVLIGTAVALGATAAYYKIKADNRYEEYEETNDPSLLNEVDDFDLYSGLAFGALQVNLAYIFYSFLSE